MQRAQNELEESLERERERSKKMKERRERKMERPKDNAVVHWRPYHVAEWISDVLELPQYSQNFTENSVDGLLLCSLTDTDLKKFIRIRARLHRAKILVHVQRLRELSGISDIVSTSPRKAGAASRNAKSSGADVAWGGTGIPGSPELIRAKIRKHTGKVKKQKAALDAQDRTHSRYWPFEYNNPRNAALVTQSNVWDFGDDWADQFNDDDPFEDHDDIDDENDGAAEAPGEKKYRETMVKVWKDDAQAAQAAGTEVVVADAFGIDAAGGADAAASDPYHFVMKFANENQMTFYEAIMAPEIKRMNLRLKTGHSVYSTAQPAVTCRQLPPEYWFCDRLPWWMEMEMKRKKSTSKSSKKMKRRIPSHCTTEEVLATVKQAIIDYGRELHERKVKEMDEESLQSMLEAKRQRIRRLRRRQKMPEIDPLCEEEDRLLSDVYHAMKNAENNETIMHGKGGSRTGFTDKLNRLKFQGAVEVLLRLSLNWQQFNALFECISTDGDGNVQEDEFVAAFRSEGQYADLRRKDAVGEKSRQGGRQRRLLKSMGYFGSGAKRATAKDSKFVTLYLQCLRRSRKARSICEKPFKVLIVVEVGKFQSQSLHPMIRTLEVLD